MQQIKHFAQQTAPTQKNQQAAKIKVSGFSLRRVFLESS
jgi:hypothetical protein